MIITLFFIYSYNNTGDKLRIKYDEDKLIIYLKVSKNMDKDILCNKLIDNLKKNYNIKFRGFYNIDIYKYNNDIVIEIIEDINNVPDYYNRVDLNINVIETIFLYEIKDILDTNIKFFYMYKDKYYILFNNISNNNIEFGNIIYKNTKDILKNSEKIYM